MRIFVASYKSAAKKQPPSREVKLRSMKRGWGAVDYNHYLSMLTEEPMNRWTDVQEELRSAVGDDFSGCHVVEWISRYDSGGLYCKIHHGFIRDYPIPYGWLSSLDYVTT